MPRESVRVERIDAKRESMRRDSRCQEGWSVTFPGRRSMSCNFGR